MKGDPEPTKYNCKTLTVGCVIVIWQASALYWPEVLALWANTKQMPAI